MSEKSAPDLPQTAGLLPWGRTLLTGAAAVGALGLALGDFPYLIIAAILGAAALAFRASPLPALAFARHVGAPQARSEEDVDVRGKLTWAAESSGAAIVHDAVPDSFPLAAGTNFRAFALDRARDADVQYSATTTRRGAHHFGPAVATFPDPLGAAPARRATLSEKSDLVVQAAASSAPHVKTPNAWGVEMLPAGDRGARGVATNDFRELRPYEPGDPLRSVNWKATARASTRDMQLVVNQYEVESKKAVWVFLDASWYTGGGSSAWTTFDELAQGALAVARHYLDRGHRVGITLYGGAEEPTVLFPDSGSAQERRLANLLTFAEPAAPPAAGETLARAGLGRAVERSRGFLAREKPVSFVFTLIGRDATLEKGVTEARALASTGRRPGLVAVLAPTVARAPAGIAARFVAIREKLQVASLERRGVRVARWDPKRAPLAALLMRGVVR